MDRNLGNEGVAVDEFQEAIKMLDRLTLKPEEVSLEQRVRFFQMVAHLFVLLECMSKLIKIFPYAAPFNFGISQESSF